MRLSCPWDSPGNNIGVGCHFLLQCRKVKSESEVAQLHPTVSNSMDCSLLGSSTHGIFQARVLEWGATAFSSDFPYFLQFKSEFDNKEFMIWATVSSWSCFCWLYRAFPSSAAKNIINLILILTIWWCPYLQPSLQLLEEGVCYDQCVLLAKPCQSLPCFILYSMAKLASYSRYFLTSCFCIPVPYDQKDNIFGDSSRKRLVGHHRAFQLQLLWH